MRPQTERDCRELINHGNRVAVLRQIDCGDVTPAGITGLQTNVMEVLGEPKPPRGEVLVERVKALRFAENNGQYQRMFAALNG